MFEDQPSVTWIRGEIADVRCSDKRAFEERVGDFRGVLWGRSRGGGGGAWARPRKVALGVSLSARRCATAAAAKKVINVDENESVLLTPLALS